MTGKGRRDAKACRVSVDSFHEFAVNELLQYASTSHRGASSVFVCDHCTMF